MVPLFLLYSVNGPPTRFPEIAKFPKKIKTIDLNYMKKMDFSRMSDFRLFYGFKVRLLPFVFKKNLYVWKTSYVLVVKFSK